MDLYGNIERRDNLNEMERDICNFDKYLKQTMDLLRDGYKWKMMAKYSDDENMRQKYMQVSDALFNMFMVEHNNMKSLFSNEQ